jgi:hypothetical protein
VPVLDLTAGLARLTAVARWPCYVLGGDSPWLGRRGFEEASYEKSVRHRHRTAALRSDRSRGRCRVGLTPRRTSGNCDSCGARVVVRDRDTGQPLYRVEPDPFHPRWQRVDDYNTGQPLREVRPDPFNVDQSVIDDR